MEISGKVIQIIDPVSGTSSKGKWKKQEVIIEMDEKFNPKLAITNWNDKVDISGLTVGNQVKASVNIESREYNGRWFTEAKMWKIELLDAQTTPTSELSKEENVPVSFSLDDEENDPFTEEATGDDLPF